MRRTGPRALRHHRRLHRLLPYLLERRGVLSSALLADTKQRLDGGFVPGRVQLCQLLGVPLKSDLVALALLPLRESHALRLCVRVHGDFAAAGGGARSDREPARAAIVPSVVVKQRDVDGFVGLLEVLAVFLHERVDLAVAQPHPERIARDVRLGNLESCMKGPVRVQVEPHVGPAEGIVDQALDARAHCTHTLASVRGVDAEPLQRRRYVEIIGVFQPQSLLPESQRIEITRIALHRVQVRRREHARHRAWARQI